MSAGTKYDLAPQAKPREFYRVETGVRKSGPWKLKTANLTIGSFLPPFTPVAADLKNRTVTVVRNVLVVEEYKKVDASTRIKIAKDSLAYAGMFIGNGSKGATVNAIDKSNTAYDELVLNAAIDSDIAQGDILFEATAIGGTKKKDTANFVLYDRTKVEDGALCTLLMQAYEVKEAKLPLPIHDLDKEGLTSRFQFE